MIIEFDTKISVFKELRISLVSESNYFSTITLPPDTIAANRLHCRASILLEKNTPSYLYRDIEIDNVQSKHYSS